MVFKLGPLIRRVAGNFCLNFGPVGRVCNIATFQYANQTCYCRGPWNWHAGIQALRKLQTLGSVLWSCFKRLKEVQRTAPLDGVDLEGFRRCCSGSGSGWQLLCRRKFRYLRTRRRHRTEQLRLVAAAGSIALSKMPPPYILCQPVRSKVT
jgi:hypothetical protein